MQYARAEPGTAYLDRAKCIFEWSDIHDALGYLHYVMDYNHYVPKKIVGISRGGSIPAVFLSHQLSISEVAYIRIKSYTDDRKDQPPIIHPGDDKPGYNSSHTLFIDDIWDSGETIALLRDHYPDATFATLFYKVKPDGDLTLPPLHFPGIRRDRVTIEEYTNKETGHVYAARRPIWYKFPWEATPIGWS